MTKSTHRRRHYYQFGIAGILVLLSSTAVSSSDSTNGANIERDTSGNFQLSWDADTGYYYFVERSLDLMDFEQIKLYTDLDEDGTLGMGFSTTANPIFFRFYNTDDPGDIALSRDDDGDGIVNRLEADAGMDAFGAEDPTDSDSDGIPDFWEQFFFDTLEHDGSHIAVVGGLTLAAAFDAAANPLSLDSDGDGWTDVQEIEWGWNVNYDQSRDDGIYGPYGDADGDGVSNLTEVLNGSDPTDPDSGSDLILSPYVLVDLGAGKIPVELGNKGHVLLDAGSDQQQRWYWGQTLDFSRTGSSSGDYISDMNNHGELVGFSFHESYQEYYVSYLDGEPCYSNIFTIQKRTPFKITASGTREFLPMPTIANQLVADGMYMPSKIHDNGDYLMKIEVIYAGACYVRGYQLLYDSAAAGFTTDYETSAWPSCSSSTGVYGVREHGSALAFVTVFNNQGLGGGFSRVYDNYSTDDCDPGGSMTFGYFLGAPGNQVDFDPVALNQQGLLLSDTKLRQITNGQVAAVYDLPTGSGILDLDTPDVGEPLQIIGTDRLFVQKRDPNTDELVSLGSGEAAFAKFPAEVLLHAPDEEAAPTTNAEWSNLRLRKISDNGDFIAATADDANGVSHAVLLLKVDFDIHDENGNPQIATEDNPANVPVNGDFDEEKQVNGRYVRDYEDANLEFATDSNDLKTDDLRGCVVDIPGLDDSVWQNTTLKIRKKSGVIDPLTNEEEAGEIRIHAIDGSNNWVEVPQDTDLAPDYYVSTGQYANYDSCWIEGIKDGPITLELEVVINGGTPILVEKKAMICTEKTKAEWLEELRDEMDMLSGVDMNQFNPSNGFMGSRSYLKAVYFYYEELFFRETAYIWPGMAKMAGAPVYGGLSDAEYGDSVFTLPIILSVMGLGSETVEVNLTNLSTVQTTLIEVNKAIYEDLAWKFKAYHTSGLSALEYSAETVNFNEGVIDIQIWRRFKIADDTDYTLMKAANRDLLFREQSQIVVPGWTTIADLNLVGGSSSGFFAAKEVFSRLAENPIPGGEDFRDVVSSGDITDFDDRWEWIDDSSKGMWKLWTDFSIVQQRGYVEIPLITRAAEFAWLVVL